ncbi:hypothetical protein CEXT_396391 [Caerostris extrusa]|uniref:Uncharacterized protein n=1 Tax=Caerostris extrusa TaxID=172846 RepID=A0AAV4Y3N0_CAEEX|nr:hypothetical protein CEXT_396391 [Caerostris extrusa]
MNQQQETPEFLVRATNRALSITKSEVLSRTHHQPTTQCVQQNGRKESHLQESFLSILTARHPLQREGRCQGNVLCPSPPSFVRDTSS